LVTDSGPIPSRLVTRLAVAASVFTLSRETSPFWLLLIAFALLGITERDRLRAIVASHAARVGAGIVFGLTVLQTAWDLAVSPFGVKDRRVALDGSTVELVRAAAGELVTNYREAVGTFGWFTDFAPMPVTLLWTVGLGSLVLAALMFARRREVIVMSIVLAIAIVLPVIADAAIARDTGLSWQGRYILPFAAGVPMLAAFAIRRSPRLDAGGRRSMTVALLAIFVVAQVWSYAQQLRRYTVGRDGRLSFFVDWDWSPPVPPFVLLIAYTLCIVGIGLVLCAPVDPARFGAVRKEPAQTSSS
jgi:hypothetical protein